MKLPNPDRAYKAIMARSKQLKKGTITIWVTKDANKYGVREIEVTHFICGDRAVTAGSPGTIYLRHEYEYTREAAVQAAQQIIVDKIREHEQEIAKLKAIVIE